MKQTTRCQLCRGSFVLFCFLPTLMVGLAILWLRSDAHQEVVVTNWQQALSGNSGLLVAVESIEHTDRGSTVLHNVRWTDAESRELVASVLTLETAQRDSQWVVLAGQMQILPGKLSSLAAILQQQMRLQGTSAPNKVWLEASDVTVHAGSEQAARTFRRIQCAVEADNEMASIRIEMWPAGREVSEPATLVITRNRQVAPAETGWEFHSGSVSQPCVVLADYLPVMRRMGARSQFRGSIWVRPNRRDRSDKNQNVSLSGGSPWDVEVTGQFDGVDLDELMRGLPHRFSGEARILLTRTQLRGGRLESATGSITVGTGTVSRSFLAALQEQIGAVTLADDQAPLYRISQAGVGFKMDAETGLSLVGQCPPHDPAVMIVSDHGKPILMATSRIVPVHAIVRALVPPNGMHVPVSAETERILRWLPIPSATQSVQNVARPGHPRIQLQDTETQQR